MTPLPSLLLLRDNHYLDFPARSFNGFDMCHNHTIKFCIFYKFVWKFNTVDVTSLFPLATITIHADTYLVLTSRALTLAVL